MQFIELFTDFICMEKTGYDIAYITEVDPLWNDDSLEAIHVQSPLFGNLLLKWRVLLDNYSSQVSTPLDFFIFSVRKFREILVSIIGNANTNNLIECSKYCK